MGALKDAKPSAGNRIPDKSRVTVFVKKAECKASKEKGNPMIEIDLVVAEGEHAEKEWREWFATQDSGTWGYKSALFFRAAGLGHMIDGEVQSPDQDIANALLGKYLIVDVALEVEKNKDGTEKTYQGTDGNVYPSTRNRGTAWYAHQTAPVQQPAAQRAAAPAPVQQPVQAQPQQHAPAQQYQQPAQQYAPPPQQAPVQQAPQYVQPASQQAPQYAPPPAPAPVQQFAQPAPGQPAPWQVPPQAPPKGKKAKQG